MTELDWAGLLAPATMIGFAGTVGGMLWPLAPRRVGMLWGQAVAGACFTVHYALIGAATGSVINLLSTLQCLAAIPLERRPGFRRLYLVTLPVLAVAVALTWQGLPSALAAVAMALMSLGRYQVDERRFRIACLAALICWFGHNWLVGSLPGMMSDTVGFANSLFMLRRRPPAAVRVPAG